MASVRISHQCLAVLITVLIGWSLLLLQTSFQTCVKDPGPELRIEKRSLLAAKYRLYLESTSFFSQDVADLPTNLPPLKLLLLFSRHWLETGKDQRETGIFKAFSEDPRFNTTTFGPGYEGYDQKRNSTVNLRTKFGDANNFDVILFDVGATYVQPPAGLRSIISVHVHEVLPDKSYEMANVIFFAYAQVQLATRLKYERLSISTRNRLFITAQHPADSQHFCQRTQKHNDFAMVGRINPGLYPYRTKYFEYMANWINASSEQAQAYGTFPHSYVALADGANHSTYSQVICSSRFVFITGGHSDWELRKYTEALMCGSILIGRIPKARTEFWRDLVVPIRSNTFENFRTDMLAVSPKLAEFQARVDIASKVACETLTYPNLVDKMYQVWQQYRINKVRGYFSEVPFAS